MVESGSGNTSPQEKEKMPSTWWHLCGKEYRTQVLPASRHHGAHPRIREGRGSLGDSDLPMKRGCTCMAPTPPTTSIGVEVLHVPTRANKLQRSSLKNRISYTAHALTSLPERSHCCKYSPNLTIWSSCTTGQGAELLGKGMP